MATADEARLRIVNRSVNPLLDDLPEWVKSFRPHQIDAIHRIREAFDSVDVVVLAAPTGSGKTLIGETIGRMVSPGSRLYVCSSKMLQDQFVRDFPYASLLKGRANYPTQKQPQHFHPEDFMGHVSCEDCTWSLTKSCKLCSSKFKCPYEVAKKTALASKLSVLNTSYLLTEANRIGRFSGREFTIIDEADTLEATLMGHVSVEIGERRLGQLGWGTPARVTVEDSWDEWLGTAIADLRNRVTRFPSVFSNLRDARQARYITRLLDQLVAVRDGIPSGNWVYTGRGGKDDPSDRGRGVSFRPARVDHLGQGYLWRHSRKWLLMSATIISSQELMESLGYSGDYATVNVKSTFPVKNRLVYFRGSTSMAFKNREAGAWDEMGAGIVADLVKHPTDRVLIHTVSYVLTEHLYRYILAYTDRPVYRYSSAAERDMMVQKYLDNESSVLLGPSLSRGLDLPNDACRVQMLTKVPYPYVKDRQVNKRLYSQGGRVWYAVQTVRELVQMCGRAIRSEDDWAVTYIYDKDFSTNLWARNRNLFPDWFREAIVWR